MPRLDIAGMAYSDLIIYNVLERLIAERGPEAVISQATISAASRVPLGTVQDALRRMKRAGLIKGEFTRGIGYTYTLTERAPAGQ